MWSIWVKGATLLLLFAVLAQAKREGCTCGNLGSGSDPCSCNEVVVKAAKVTKPLIYASPQAINEAATLRENGGCVYTEALQVNANSQSAAASSAPPAGDSFPEPPSPPNANDCGCGGASASASASATASKIVVTPAEVRELLTLNPNTPVAPSFSPIGDLCYSKGHPQALTAEERVKVTPAYPGKFQCCEGTPYEECVRIVSGMRGPSGATAKYEDVSLPIYGPGGYPNFGAPIGRPNSRLVGINYGGSTAVFGNPAFYSDEIPAQYRPQEQMPADPISLTLAYKNLVVPTMYYNNKKGKKVVSEGGLSFGHRTLPVEAKSEKKVPDIPEEKLFTVDKPVMELKISPLNPLAIGDSDDEDENLAEFEAMEQENLEQKEQVDRVASSFLSYGDVGYGPIDTSFYRPSVTLNPQAVNIHGGAAGGGASQNMMSISYAPNGDQRGADMNGACGPVGPPVPGYVPGSVIVQREEYEPMEPRETEELEPPGPNEVDVVEDIDVGPASGLIARLRSSARKYGGSCH